MARGKGTRDQVRVSKVFQKAGVTVNEVGSEAYAATEIQLVNKFGGDGTQIFNANRPFVFFIEDEHTGSLLVVGKVEDPTKWENSLAGNSQSPFQMNKEYSR